jgi:hypothetical protein
MLYLLIPLIWLLIATLVLGACRAAARGEEALSASRTLVPRRRRLATRPQGRTSLEHRAELRRPETPGAGTLTARHRPQRSHRRVGCA